MSVFDRTQIFLQSNRYDARLPSTWTPKVRKIMAFMAVVMGLGLLFYIVLGSS